MTQILSFHELLDKVRVGDESAAEELFRLFEPHVRRVIRIRFTDPALKRQFDESDLRQSVMADFFVRAALGQFELQNAGQLIGLLEKMALNKLLGKTARQHAARRDTRRLEPAGIDESVLAAPDASPSRIVAGRELLTNVRARLTNDERYLADQRAAGKTWGEIAVELGKAADTLRMQLTRALNRVSQDLGLSSINYD